MFVGISRAQAHHQVVPHVLGEARFVLDHGDDGHQPLRVVVRPLRARHRAAQQLEHHLRSVGSCECEPTVLESVPLYDSPCV